MSRAFSVSRRMKWTGAALAAVAAVTVLVGPPESGATAASRDFFPVPDAALVRSLGDIGHGTCAPPPGWQACQGDSTPVEGPSGLGSIFGEYPMSVPGLGVPVGGVGAGSFMINQDGTFGPWNFGGSQGSTWETRILPQAAFHLREQFGSGPATVKTLATDGPANSGVNGPVSARSWGSPLPAWNALQPGDGSTAALYPFGWESFSPFKTDVSLRYFSPIVAGEDRRTSLPLVYFDVRIANHTASNANVSVMFTMPNAPDHVAGTKGDPSSPDGPASVRAGYTSVFRNTNGVQAVTLGAGDPLNTPDAADSEWTIAAKPGPGQKVSYTTSWNAAGDGSDVYAPFSSSGSLPDTAIDRSDSAGAISVSAKLQPGQTTIVPFALAWDFPQVGYDNNQTVWMRRYTDFYGAQETASNDYIMGSYPGKQSYNIASDALLAHDANLTAVQNWWNPIADNAAYPAVLRMAALNQLSQLVFSNSFWEGGLAANSVIPTGYSSSGPGNHLDASRPGSHLFGVMDGAGGGVANEGWTDNIETHGYTGYFKLFPNLMGDYLQAQAEASALTPHQNTVNSLYSTSPDPFIIIATGSSNPVIQDGSAAASPGQTQFLDAPMNVVFEWYDYYKATGDTAFLRNVYPGIKRDIAYVQGTIPAGTYLPDDAPAFANVFDTVPQGSVGVYDSELYLLSLEIGIAAGNEAGDDPAYVAGLQQDLTNAKSQFELTLWNPVQQYYRFDLASVHGDAAFNDTFFAQHLAESVGLPDLVDQSRHQAQLTTTFPFWQRQTASGQATGAPMLVEPGDIDAASDGYYPPEVSWVWPGTDFSQAADYISTGRRYDRPDLQADGLQIASAAATQLWLDADNGFPFDPPCGYGDTDPSYYAYPAYSMAMSIWSVLDAVQPVAQAAIG